MFCKTGKHHLMAPGDRLGTECRHCHNERQQRYAARRKIAMHLLQEIEAAGVSLDDITPDTGYFVGLAYALATSESDAQRIARKHPALIEKFRRRIDKIES